MLKTISIDEFQEGMVLAASVKNKFGQTLIVSNTVLGKEHLGLFKTWGIEHFSILTGDEEHDVIDDSLVAEAKEKLYSRMDWEPRNKYEENLLDMGIEHLTESMN